MRMRTCVSLMLVLGVVTGCTRESAVVMQVDGSEPRAEVQQLDLSGNDLVKIDAQPGQGFNFPYYLFIPESVDREKAVHLFVEPNNTGTGSDDFEVHRKKAESLAEGSYANRMAKRLKVPLLVPVFPRSRSNWRTYTHSLDRDTLEIKRGQLCRIDLQLVAMIGHAQKLLRAGGFKVKSRVFMHGFSASGNFANRFAFLHPKVLKAVASGGVNGIPTLPVKRWNGHDLPFPIGIADLEELAGAPFDEEAYRQVPQYIYMGYLDRNDTVPSRDAWGESEAALIQEAVAATMMPDRWEVSQSVYRDQKLPVQCVTYNGTHHTIKKEMLEDLVEFFQANSGDEFVRIDPHSYPFVEHREIREAHVNGLYWEDDDRLPDFIRGKLGERVTFLIGIEEWMAGHGHRQLRRLVENAGFNFVLKAGGGDDILIDQENFGGNCSSGGGEFQAFYVHLDTGQLLALVPGLAYSLHPVNQSETYFWTVREGVTLKRPTSGL
jgi:hypothetical protein